jgi:hypothetical protein
MTYRLALLIVVAVYAAARFVVFVWNLVNRRA